MVATKDDRAPPPPKRTYKLNSEMIWRLDNDFPANTPMWILAEKDECDPTGIPSVFRVIYDPTGPFGCKMKLLDFDPEHHEEILSPNNWGIMAWRPMTDHGGTWDKHYQEAGVSELSNWVMTLDKQEDEECSDAGQTHSSSVVHEETNDSLPSTLE